MAKPATSQSRLCNALNLLSRARKSAVFGAFYRRLLVNHFRLDLGVLSSRL
jgi:hypothetical protein